MSGFRQNLFAQAVEIIPSVLSRGLVTPEHGAALRQCWECSKRGNLLIDALREVEGFAPSEYIEMLILSPGFLSKREAWHKARLAKKQIIAWRGCPKKETQPDKFDLGYSWTLNRRVAEFFAGRFQDGGECAIVQAKISQGIWLDTQESEVVGLDVGPGDILAIQPAGSGPGIDDGWKSVRTISPRREHFAGR